MTDLTHERVTVWGKSKEGRQNMEFLKIKNRVGEIRAEKERRSLGKMRGEG